MIFWMTEKKKNSQESEDESSRLDKRIEWARAIYEFARLGMGTIFASY